VNLAVISTEVNGSWRLQSDFMRAVVGGGKIQPLTKQHETRKRVERSKQNTKNEWGGKKGDRNIKTKMIEELTEGRGGVESQKTN